jgi:hypothetical protein|tara:strand:+ start:41 stop:337 length:297 start_codon:yes stop_codon:yes gene_type:complete
MKTVIVLDTEDTKGLAAAVRIAKHLEREYLSDLMPNKHTTKYSSHDLSFSRIPFIKVLRAFAKQIRDDVESGDLKLEDVGGLRYTKQFTDRVWNDEKF